MPMLRAGRDAVDRVVVRDESIREREHAIAHVERLRRRELRPLPKSFLPEVRVQGAEHEVNVLAVNGFGWGPASPPVRFKTLRSEVEVTGVQTQDERAPSNISDIRSTLDTSQLLQLGLFMLMIK